MDASFKLIDERQPRKIENWLHGLIRCSHCDQKLVGRLQKFRWYACPNLHGTIYRADDLESRVKAIIDEFIFDVVSFQKLAEKASSKNGATKEFEKLQKEESRFSKELETLNTQLDTLTRKNLAEIIDDEQYVRLKNQINEEKATYSEKLKEIRFKLENLSRRMGESPRTQYERILPLVLAKGLTAQDYRKIMEGLGAEVATQKVEVVCDLSETADELVQELYDQGYIVLKNFKNDLGWSAMRVYRRYGKTGRKVAIDWRAIVEMNWTTLKGWLPEGVVDLQESPLPRESRHDTRPLKNIPTKRRREQQLNA